MVEALPWRFIIFALIFAGLIYFQFYLAHRQWRRLRGEQATDIDINYVRSENYFGQSFRRKVEDWRRLPAVAIDGAGGMAIAKGDERIRVLEVMELPGGSDCDDILVIEQGFCCGPESRLRREVLVHGDATIGAGSRLQSLAADGSLALGENVHVARWVDAAGEMTIGPGCRIHSRATSQTRITLSQGVEVASAYAPEVATTPQDDCDRTFVTPPAELLQIAMYDQAEADPELEAAGMRPGRLLQLGSDTWLYKGSLELHVPVRISTKLAVTGNCSFRAGSVIEADLKSGGSISLAPFCTINGNLIAEKNIFAGSGCHFSGVINAGEDLLLSSGTRGSRPDGMVVAYAGGQLSVEGDVVIKGKLSAGRRVVVIDSLQSTAWKARRKIEEDSRAEQGAQRT
jgi:predicted acyltransferase (DUF342 family)